MTENPFFEVTGMMMGNSTNHIVTYKKNYSRQSIYSMWYLERKKFEAKGKKTYFVLKIINDMLLPNDNL